MRVYNRPPRWKSCLVLLAYLGILALVVFGLAQINSYLV